MSKEAVNGEGRAGRHLYSCRKGGDRRPAPVPTPVDGEGKKRGVGWKMGLIRGALRRRKIVRSYNYLVFGWLSCEGVGTLRKQGTSLL